MSWEQHRYAVERAARMRREFAERHNEASQGVNLQGEANGSDAEMLEEVAEYLKSLDADPGEKERKAAKAVERKLYDFIGRGGGDGSTIREYANKIVTAVGKALR